MARAHSSPRLEKDPNILMSVSVSCSHEQAFAQAPTITPHQYRENREGVKG